METKTDISLIRLRGVIYCFQTFSVRYQLSTADRTIDLNLGRTLETLGDLLRLPGATPHPDQLHQIF